MPDFVKTDAQGFSTQLQNAATKAMQHATVLNLQQNHLDERANDAAYFEWTYNVCHSIHKKNLEATAYYEQLRSPSAKFYGQPLGNAPINFIFPTQPVVVAVDVEGRFRAFAKYCKAQANYTNSIGLDLGIVAVAATPPNLATMKPTIKVAIEAGAVSIRYTKGKMEGIEVFKDTGSGFALIGVATAGSVFIDKTAMPPYNSPAVWQYKAIYRYKGNQVGVYSDLAVITVMNAV